ncbi:sensor histidine kinase [Humibacter soli]
MVDPRWRTVLTVVPYVVLALLVVYSLFIGWDDPARLIPELILCAAYGIWVLVMRTLPTSWRDRPASIAVFMTVAILINLVLVLLDSWFAFLTIATFSFAYSLVEWPWELLAVGATAVVSGTAQASSFGPDVAGISGRVLVIVLNIVVMCGLAWGVNMAQWQQARASTLEATSAERTRLAREIHDTLAQGFIGIITQLQAADQASDEALRRRHTDAALALARDGLAEARRSVQALRPAALEAGRLPEAITAVARDWSARTGIPVHVRTSGSHRSLPTDAEVALLRTAQEALANVERHAHANSVTLTLTDDERGARLEVRDDGRGFDPAALATGPVTSAGASEGTDGAAVAEDVGGGYGLIAMRERLEAVAGVLVVEARQGRGTAIRAEVPA